ncbi:MAG: YqeG family HAD IIIA-type phosphatase [Clostridia bacterium]|nr:YqeG family HAD IIIA-type phosphatase [Clostridia bacterium]
MTLVPDLYCDDIYGITPEYVKGKGIEAVILDIDNTLVPYEIAEPTPDVRAWLQALTDNGIKVAFVSNNHAERVELFNRTLGFPAFPDSGKPFKRACRAAMEAMGSKPENTAIIGDQVFTDVLAGRNAGLAAAFLVKPIKDKTNLFFKAKRLLEVPVLKKYKRMQKKKGDMGS